MLLDRRWRQRGDRGKAVVAIGLVALLLNAGHYYRVTRLYGSPLGPGRDGPFVFTNESFRPSALVSNLVGNIALHVGTPNEHVNTAVESGILWLHHALGIGINDPRTTWLGTGFHVTTPNAHEDYAANFAHTALTTISCALLLAVPALRRRGYLLAYTGSLASGLLLFALCLKWQPWHSRLHLPLFVLGSPLIAVVWGHYRRAMGIVVALLLATSVPWVVYNSSRPLLGPASVPSRAVELSSISAHDRG
jgi:hypothetical protein